MTIEQALQNITKGKCIPYKDETIKCIKEEINKKQVEWLITGFILSFVFSICLFVLFTF